MCRVFRASGSRVTQVMNLTDIDDKTIRGAVAEGLPLREFTAEAHRDLLRGPEDAERRPGGRSTRAPPTTSPRWSRS